MSSFAQQVPPSADVGRVDENLRQTTPPKPKPRLPLLPQQPLGAQPPANAENIQMTLRMLEVDGALAFSEDEIQALYAEHLGQEIRLSMVWEIAQKITAFYQEKGYFLSRAYVPEQAIDAGYVVIKVVEGYISRIVFDDPLAQHPFLRQTLESLENKPPLRRQDLEHFLLRLNDLGGVAFDALLKPETQGSGRKNGGVVLELTVKQTAPRLQASVDNYGSEFLGPLQFNTSLQASLIPFHETTLNVAASLPADELKTVSLTHKIPLKAGVKGVLRAGVTDTTPGASLAANDVQGDSTFFGLGVEYEVQRLRQKNLKLTADLDLRNSTTDLLNNTIVDDKTRSLTVGVAGDFYTSSGAYQEYGLNLRRGIDIFGGSDEGDANLSRTNAEPNFTKLYGDIMWQRPVFSNFMVQFQAEGQWAGESLLSSEEFGFGGARMGRAFDASEISGDSGFGASFELHYVGVPEVYKTRTIPFVFYDIGRVWNHEQGRENETASSAGLGLRLMHEASKIARIYADVYAAQPVIKHQDNPLIGSGQAPRIGFRVGVLK